MCNAQSGCILYYPNFVISQYDAQVSITIIIIIFLFLSKQYVDILESYLIGRFFRIKQGDAYSERKEIKAGVPQGIVLGPVLYVLYTSDLPKLENNSVATFAEDTAILAVGSSNEESTGKLQTPINQIQKWTKNDTSNLMNLNRFILILPTDASNTSQ